MSYAFNWRYVRTYLGLHTALVGVASASAESEWRVTRVREPKAFRLRTVLCAGHAVTLWAVRAGRSGRARARTVSRVVVELRLY